MSEYSHLCVWSGAPCHNERFLRLSKGQIIVSINHFVLCVRIDSTVLLTNHIHVLVRSQSFSGQITLTLNLEPLLDILSVL